MAVVLGVAAVGAVVGLYALGLLPLAGPFVAVLVVPVIVLGVLRWHHRRVRRAGEELRRRLDELAALLGSAAPVASRGGSVRDDLEASVQYLAWSHEPAAVESAERLVAAVRIDPHAGDDVLAQAERVSEAAHRLADVHARYERLGRRVSRGSR